MRKDGWFSWLVWDPCCAAMPLWTLLVVSSRQPCRGGEGRASPVHLGCPLLRGPAGPSGPQQQQLWPQRGQGEGKAPGRPRPTAPLPPGWPFQLATSSEWAGCGIPIILCRAGMWKPDPSPLVWWGWGGGHSTEVKGLEGHWTCEAGLQGGGGQPTHP